MATASQLADTFFSNPIVPLDAIDHEWNRQITRKAKLLYILHTWYAVSKNPHMHREYMITGGSAILVAVERVKRMSDDLQEVDDG